ncbi:MAG: glycosyltransferase family 39 protein [Planctomycetota bacterium]|nr:MAG: glycosyltransferase family 39 protein [Planctomycetota bacterium]
MLKPLRLPALLAAIAACMFFVNLGATHLWDVDEAIFSQAAKEMYLRGDLVTPYFNGQVFPDKPAMMYWLMISAYEVFGTTEFAARFWSAVFGIGSVLLTYRLGRLAFSPSVAFWSGLILATSLNFNIIARAATPDAFLTFFCTLAMLLFVAATAKARPQSGQGNERNAPWAGQTRFEPSWWGWCTVYAAMGAAVLTKGPIGVVLPTASIGLFLLVVRAHHAPTVEGTGWKVALVNLGRWLAGVLAPLHVLRTIWSMRPLTALAMVLLVAGPWYALVGMATDGEWLAGFFGVHNFGRFAHAMDDHSGPIFYYLIAIAIGFFPWSVFASPTLLQMRTQVREGHPWRPGYALAGSWIAVWVGFFSLAGTKLPSYIIPAYPALALLTACFVAQWIHEPAAVPRLFTRLAWGCVALVGVGLVIALPIAAHLVLEDEWFLGALGAIPLAAAIVGWIYSERQQARRSAWTMAAAGAAMWIAMLGFLAPYVDRYQDGPAFAERIAADTAGRPAAVKAFRHFRPSHVYYTDTTVEKIDSPEQVGEFFAAHPADAFVITNEGQFKKLHGQLPADVVVLESRRQIGQDEHVLLLGRDRADVASRPSPGESR